MNTGQGSRPATMAVTLGVGLLGGAVAWMLGLPLAWLLGAMMATALVAQSGLRPLGRGMYLPGAVRARTLPIIGVAIGAAFTPEVAGQLVAWWPTALALAGFLPVAMLTGMAVFRLGGLPLLDSLYGALPGGLIESAQLAEEAGADPATVTLLHLVRIVATLTAIPLIFIVLTGQVVGRSAGMVLSDVQAAASMSELVILLAIAAAGYLIAARLRLPAAHIVGPLVLSALAYGTGIVQGVLPGWLIAAAQVIVGCALGARFAGVDRVLLMRVAGLSLASALLLIGLALGLSAVLGPIVGEPLATVFLAFAPGGLAEMSLIALSAGVGIPFVMMHHLLRVVLSLVIARVMSRILIGKPAAGSDGRHPGGRGDG